MSEYNKTVLTNAGLDLMARANKGTAKFTITRAATSTEQLADKSMVDLQQLTELPGLMQYGIINDVANSSHDSNIVIGVELVFNNQDLSNGYNINTIGLFAKEDGQEKEILYAITTAIAPESMPDFKNKVLFKFNVTMFVAVSRADNVAVNVTDNGVVTQEQLTHAIQQLPQKQDITNIYNKVDEINQTIEKNIKDLAALNSPNGNNIYNTTIDLDNYSKPGITKFLGCQLETTGKMEGYDREATNLYGWIFMVPKWNGATEYEQTVYICDYGKGTQIYVRSLKLGEAKDYERIATDRDISKIKEVIDKISSFENPDFRLNKGDKLDLDSVTSPGIYHLNEPTLTCSVNASALNGIPKYSGNTTYCGYLVVNYHDAYNITQTLMIYSGFSNPDYTIATRSVSTVNNYFRPIFRRLLNVDDYSNLFSKIELVDKKELVHFCADLDSGVAYSKANPNVFVATP